LKPLLSRGNLSPANHFSKAGFVKLDELVRSRRTVHNYTRENVDWSVIENALELSLWAPNHKLSYPWVYTRIGVEARAKLADLSVELKAKKGELSDIKKKTVRDNILAPAHILSLGIRRDADERRHHEDYATLACSVQIMVLVLWEQGIATKWSTGGNWTHAKAYEVLGLDPEEVQLEGALLIGHAQHMPEAPARPSLNEVLRESK
jgi:nitroreductase